MDMLEATAIPAAIPAKKFTGKKFYVREISFRIYVFKYATQRRKGAKSQRDIFGL
jgi:hypothetical protein